MKYRKKPVVVEAFQFGVDEMPDWIMSYRTKDNHWIDYNGFHFVITTLEGQMKAIRGDMIIKGIAGEIYPCKKDIFDATYESVKDSNK